MASFHDNYMWQAAYLAVLEVYDTTDELTDVPEMWQHITSQALQVLMLTADGLSRRDKRERQTKFRDALGIVTAVRSLLSVAWAQQNLSDEQFAKLDRTYEELATKLNH